MAEFKNVSADHLILKRQSVSRKSVHNNKMLAAAVKKKYGISNFVMRRGTFSGKPAYVFAGTKKGFTIGVGKIDGEPGFYGGVSKRGKGRALFLTTTLREALSSSNAIIKEVNKRGRVLRAS